MKLEEALRQQAQPKRRSEASGSSTGRCHSCEWTGTHAQWERTHADAEGHHRFELDLP